MSKILLITRNARHANYTNESDCDCDSKVIIKTFFFLLLYDRNACIYLTFPTWYYISQCQEQLILKLLHNNLISVVVYDFRKISTESLNLHQPLTAQTCEHLFAECAVKIGWAYPNPNFLKKILASLLLCIIIAKIRT